MSVRISPNLPATVVEIGNEITQAKLNEINSGTLALQTWVNSGYVPRAGGVDVFGIINIDQTSTTGYLTTFSGDGVHCSNGQYISQEESNISGFNIQIPYGGQITFGDSTSQSTACTYTYDPKKAIANTCASCFTTNGITMGFNGIVAISLASTGKFGIYSPYQLGYNSGSSIQAFAFSGSSMQFADSGIMVTSFSGSIFYSEDGGSSWTQSDFSF